MPQISIEVSETELERLTEIRDEQGLTWRELLLRGSDVPDLS